MNTCMLNEMEPGEQGKIITIQGGRGIRQKLSLRGVSEGSVVRMISCYHGPIIIEVSRSMVALGRGIARKIRVKGGIDR